MTIPAPTRQDKSLRLAIKQIRNAAGNLHDASLDYASPERQARNVLLAVTNALQYGNMYGPQLEAAAAEFAKAVARRGNRASTLDDFKIA